MSSEEKKRNYKKEWEKEKETKVTRLIKVEKELFAEFSEKLKKENLTINGFVNTAIKEYLKKF